MDRPAYLLQRTTKKPTALVRFSKHTVTVENQNYYEVVRSLLYITYRNFIYDVMLWRHYY